MLTSFHTVTRSSFLLCGHDTQKEDLVYQNGIDDLMIMIQDTGSLLKLVLLKCSIHCYWAASESHSTRTNHGQDIKQINYTAQDTPLGCDFVLRIVY